MSLLSDPFGAWTRMLANRFVGRVLHKAAFGGLMLLCLGWNIAQALHSHLRPAPAAVAAAVEWPTEWEGRPVRSLALGAVEARFASGFPGAITRMTDGRQLLVLRQVTQPTRMLHPAADCYQALGYRVVQARLEQDAQSRLWRCFSASRGQGVPLKVCERIVDAHGQAFTDTSAWYWAAVSGRSQGPWQAVTTAQLAPAGPL